MRSRGWIGRCAAVGIMALGAPFACATAGRAQELEPRAYANAPVGLDFLLLGYGHSRGDVLLDPALPIEDGRAVLDLLLGRFVHTLDVFGRLGKFNVLVPYTRGTFEGLLNGEPASAFRSGFGDPRVELAVGLIGTPALRGREFAEHQAEHGRGTIIGASLQVVLPLGQYEPTKLVNLGSNRWSFRPQVGVASALGSWDLELYGSAWIFTDNPDFFGGSKLEQQTIYALQAHLSYTFRPGLWLALDGGYADGGRTASDGVDADNFQKNSRVGGTLSVPIAPRHGIKLAFSSGVATRIGGDYDSFLVAYQFLW